MEKVIVVVIIIVLALMFLGRQNAIMIGVLGAVAVASAGMTLFFILYLLKLLFSKKKKGTFLRIERNGMFKWHAAIYLVDGEEIPCIFPDDGVMDDKIYRTDKTYTLFYNKRSGKVFDRISITTCVIGIIFTLGIDAALVFMYFLLYR